MSIFLSIILSIVAVALGYGLGLVIGTFLLPLFSKIGFVNPLNKNHRYVFAVSIGLMVGVAIGLLEFLGGNNNVSWVVYGLFLIPLIFARQSSVSYIFLNIFSFLIAKNIIFFILV